MDRLVFHTQSNKEDNKQMNYFTIITLILPLIQSLVKGAEESSAPGTAKKNVVAEQLKSAYELLQATGSVKEIKNVPWEAIEMIVLPLIDLVVSGWNALGFFNK
jgi:hypothetical protein